MRGLALEEAEQAVETHEPAMVSITANALINDRSDRTGESAEAIARAAWENARRLFF